MDNNDLIEFLSALHPLSKELRQRLNEVIKTQIIKKHHFLLEPNKAVNKIWFLEKGYIMGYIWKEDRKVPYRFWKEQELILSANAFFLQRPALEYIEALNPSTLKYITYDDVKTMLREFPELNIHIQRIILDYEIYQEKRVYEFAANSALENYAILAKNSPHVLRNVPVENIAAFLGISRKTLNRIRAKAHKREQRNPE